MSESARRSSSAVAGTVSPSIVRNGPKVSPGVATAAPPTARITLSNSGVLVIPIPRVETVTATPIADCACRHIITWRSSAVASREQCGRRADRASTQSTRRTMSRPPRHLPREGTNGSRDKALGHDSGGHGSRNSRPNARLTPASSTSSRPARMPATVGRTTRSGESPRAA